MAKPRHYEYDVFVSHAVEDKIGIATALQEALKAKGIRVWYSGEELSIGDRLIDTIYKGLEECRFGVVILSPTYLGKIWALGEFFYFLTRDEKGSKVILPVLYDITPEELAVRYPLMADIVAVRASLGIEHVAQKLCDVITKEALAEKKLNETRSFTSFLNFRNQGFPMKATVGIVAFLLVLVSLYIGSSFIETGVPSDVTQDAIKNHVSITQKKADDHLQELLEKRGGVEAHGDTITRIYANYGEAKSHYRNEYLLTNGESSIRAKRNVDKALDMDVSTMTPANQYLFPSSRIYRAIPIMNNGNRLEEYLFYNTAPVEFSITKTDQESEIYYVTVRYVQPVRCVFTSLVFPSSPGDTKRQQVTITGLRPVEIFAFKESNGSWSLQGIE